MSGRTMEGFAKRSRAVPPRPVTTRSGPRRGANPSGQKARQMTASEVGPPLETAQFLLKQGLNLPGMKSQMEAALARGAYEHVGEDCEDEADDGAGPTGQNRPYRDRFDSSLHETTSAENEDTTPGSQARPIDLDTADLKSHWPPQPHRGHLQESLDPGADQEQNQVGMPEHRGPYDEFEDDLDPFLGEDSQVDTQVIQNNARISNEVSQQMKIQQIKIEASQQNQIFGTDPGSLDTTVSDMDLEVENETSRLVLSQTGHDETSHPADGFCSRSGQFGSADEDRLSNERYRKMHQQQSLYEFQARQQSQKLIYEAAREKNELPTNGSRNQTSPAGVSSMYLPLPEFKVPNKTSKAQASLVRGPREQTETPSALSIQVIKNQEHQRNQVFQPAQNVSNGHVILTGKSFEPSADLVDPIILPSREHRLDREKASPGVEALERRGHAEPRSRGQTNQVLDGTVLPVQPRGVIWETVNPREIVPYGHQSGESQMRDKIGQNITPPNTRFDNNDRDPTTGLPSPTRGNRRQLTASTQFALRDSSAPETNPLSQRQQHEHEIGPATAVFGGSLTEKTSSRPAEREWRQEQRRNPTPSASNDDQVIPFQSAQQKRHREQVDDLRHVTSHDRSNNQDRSGQAQSEMLEDDLDYAPAKLLEMSFNELQSEPFDKTVTHQSLMPPVNTASHPLPERLDAVMKLGSRERTQLFASLAIEDWARAGDWLTHRLQEVTGQLNASRHERRAISRRYEEEVARRHEDAVEAHCVLDEEWKYMQNQGQNVISTPRSVRKKS